MSSPSLRAAALAFALSSWVEGLTQLRAVLLMSTFPRDLEEHFHEPQPLTSSATSWRERIVLWLKRSGRRDAQMDDTERTSLGIIDIATAFLILQMLRQPLLPFLLSPFLTTLPLPRSTSAFKPIKWPHLIFSTVLLSLLHEVERVSVFLAVDSIKQRRDSKNRALLGDIYVRGDELRPSFDNDEEEEECLICAGAGADAPLSQSISSLSSPSPSVPLDALGPLEAFCATAPQKHVAHRSCFLSWHAAYRQQRIHLSPEIVELQHAEPTEATRKRAQAIMEAAGFAYLSKSIRFSHELLWRRVQFSTSETQPESVVRPTLTLTENVAGPSSSNIAPSPIATLHTTTPPCPGCRSSVFLHFFSRPLASSRESQREHRRQDVLVTFVRSWIHHWCKLVTGRTILYRLASQWSFVMALLSMIRVSTNSPRWAT